jgi:hypothetical protein
MKTRADMLDGWTAYGDALVAERAFDEEDEEKEDDAEAANIWQRANALAEKHPDLKDALLGFARGQSDEYDFVAANIVSVLWTFRKGDSE